MSEARHAEYARLRAGLMNSFPQDPFCRAGESPAKSAEFRQEGGGHYLEMRVQPWAAMQAWMPPEQFQGFLRGNVIKYLARFETKGGIVDLRKARHYLDKLIEETEKAS